jgi:hypothetical protein
VVQHDDAVFVRGEQAELRRPGVPRVEALENGGDALDPSGWNAAHRVRKHCADPDGGAPRHRGQLVAERDELVVRERRSRHPEVERGNGLERSEQRSCLGAEREWRQLEKRGQRAGAERRDAGDATHGGPRRCMHDEGLSTRRTELEENDGGGRMMRDAGAENGIADGALRVGKNDDRLPDAGGGCDRDHRRNGSHASSRFLSAPGQLGADVAVGARRAGRSRGRENENPSTGVKTNA